MQLYIWNNPYKVAYGGSILYVAADSEEQAREMAAGRIGVSKVGLAPKDYDFGDMKLGAPDRVMDLPYAEIYEWLE